MTDLIAVVGTTTKQIVMPRINRTGLQIIMLSSDRIPGNTGTVFIGVGFPPTAVNGDPNQGKTLKAGGSITYQEQYPGDPSIPHSEVYAIADTANQVIEIIEDAYDPDLPPRAVPVVVVTGKSGYQPGGL